MLRILEDCIIVPVAKQRQHGQDAEEEFHKLLPVQQG